MGEGEKVRWTIDVKQGVETAGAESLCLEIKREDGENSYFLSTVQRGRLQGEQWCCSAELTSPIVTSPYTSSRTSSPPLTIFKIITHTPSWSIHFLPAAGSCSGSLISLLSSHSITTLGRSARDWRNFFSLESVLFPFLPASRAPFYFRLLHRVQLCQENTNLLFQSSPPCWNFLPAVSLGLVFSRLQKALLSP